MSEYTKGPWTAKDNGIYGADGYGIAYPIGQAITKLGSDEYSHQWIERNQEANTRLIAAAPELLEALESFVDFPADTFDGDHEGSFTMTAQLSLMRRARAAIAKAKGETK